MKTLRRRSERGFTLVELGIVIGVIAILATVVLVGRGFLESARVSKVVEIINSVQKASKVYAGLNAGLFPAAADATLLTTLNNRAMVQVTDGDNTTVPGFTFTRAEHAAGNTNTFGIVINCTATPSNCADIWLAKSSDTNMIAGAVGGVACDGPPPGAPPAAGTVQLCFNIF